MNHARLYDIMSGEDRSLSAKAARLGLSVLEPGYRLAIALRNKSFDLGWRKPARLPRPVLSVGNLTTGGTGKTPMVIELTKRLLDKGENPAVLMRGYMADATGTPSDEAQEIAGELGSSVPVEPNPNRAEGARRVLEKHPQTSVFILDDGYQHRQVHRDLDVVLIDATRPFAFGHQLPRGLLRESPGNLARADAVIVTRCDLVPPEALANLDRQIEALFGQPSTAHAAQTWSGFRDRHGGTLPADHLSQLKVAAVSAIGNPKAFEDMLRSAAGEVLHVDAFDDHHAYTPDEVKRLLEDAKQRGADALVVTEKDWVKWGALLAGAGIDETHAVPILRPVLSVGFKDGGGAVEALLARLTD